jgi:hypothetical protein
MILARGFFCSSSDAHQLYHTLPFGRDQVQRTCEFTPFLSFPGSFSSGHRMSVTLQGALHFRRLGHFDQREPVNYPWLPGRRKDYDKIQLC